MKTEKVFYITVILTVLFSLFPSGTIKAAAPTGNLTGSVITVNIGEIKAINQITVTDAVVAQITAANDICIRINASTNASWDVTDTIPTFGGTQSAKVEASITYPDAKIMRIDVNTNFANNGTLTITDLKYIGHTAISAGAVLQWATDNTDCSTATYGNGNANTAITVTSGVGDIFSDGTITGGSIGSKVSNVGDLNGDGYSDWILSGSNKVYIYFGGSYWDNEADITIDTDTSSASDFISSAGDVNNDGYYDIIIGDKSYSLNKGQARIFYGGLAMDNVADVTMIGESNGDCFGRSVSSAGDANNDGYDDVIIGADDAGAGDVGRAYIFYGGSPMDNVVDVIMDGEALGGDFGLFVSSAGDVNNDGYDDAIITDTAWNDYMGRAYIFYGGSPMNNAADVTMSGTVIWDDYFGYSVSGAGDVNNDGYDDVIIGAQTDSYNGKVYLYYGGSPMNNVIDLTMSAEPDGGTFGTSISQIGDINEDSYDDIIIGDYWQSGGHNGRAYVFYGGSPMNNVADLTLSGELASNYFGEAVSGGGDVNRDGNLDVIVGANGYNSSTGRVYVELFGYSGDRILTGITSVPTNPASGVTTNYTINFSVPSFGVIPKDGKILIDFPDDFDVTGVTIDSATGIDGTFIATAGVGAVVTLTRQNDGTNSLGGTKQIILNTIINSPVVANNKTLDVTTRTNGDNLLATGTSSNFTINPAQITTLTCAPSGQAGAVYLSWTVPQLVPTSYTVKYATTDMTNDIQFNAATTFNQAWAGGVAGTIKQELVNGIYPATYFFNVKVTGAGGAVSLISNTGVSCTASGGQTGSPLDAIPPLSLITDPKNGATVPAGQDYVIKGTSSDSGGSSVKEVIISFNGGKTWLLPVTASAKTDTGFDWVYTWKALFAGEYILVTKATDWYGNTESLKEGLLVKVVAQSSDQGTANQASQEASRQTVSEKSITQMTKEELEARALEIQKQIIELLKKLIELIQNRIREFVL